MRTPNDHDLLCQDLRDDYGPVEDEICCTSMMKELHNRQTAQQEEHVYELHPLSIHSVKIPLKLSLCYQLRTPIQLSIFSTLLLPLQTSESVGQVDTTLDSTGQGLAGRLFPTCAKMLSKKLKRISNDLMNSAVVIIAKSC
jgi:hypothetical protein